MTARRTIIAFYLVGTAFFIAHTVNAVIAEALLVPSGFPATLRSAALDPAAGRSPSAIAEQVLHSHLFPLPPEAMTSPGGGPAASVVRQPLNLASKMKLLGVVMSDRGGMSAIVEMLASKQQMFFRLHDQIPDIGELSEVRRNGIVVRQGTQEELLEMITGQPENAPTPVAVQAPTAAAPGAPIRKSIDKREVDQALNDLPKLLSQARAVPVMANGAMSGFRMDYIAPGSFYEKIGLQYGDVLKQVNGVEIKDPGTMLTLFQQLRNERTVKLDILRNNQRTTMAYEIR